MINKTKYFFLMILCVGLFGISNTVSAQSNDARVNKLIEFYEWTFDAKFTADERRQYEAIKAQDFSKDPEGEGKSADQTIANYKAILAKNENEQEKIRGNFQPDFIKQLRDMNGNEEATLLLSIYDRAQQTASSEAEANGAGDLSAITGKWVWAHTGGSVIGTSGAYLGSNGSRFTYQFSPDGAVEFTGIMNIMQGGCSQQVFQSRKGQASLSGDTLTIRWQPEKFTRDFSCDTANNYTKTMPAKVERVKVRLKTDLGQKQLCFVGSECFSETR